MKNSFKLATFFHIPIEINYSWFIVLGLVIFTLANGYFPATNPELEPIAHWLMALIAALLLFASLLAHELSHSVVAQRNNLPIKGITLFVFGGVAQMEKEPQTPSVEFKMAIAGPLMSFFLAGVFFLLTQAMFNLHAPRAFISITNYLSILNIMVGLFNLIPGFPLDGGRVFRAILWHFSKDLRKATAIASGMGKGFAYFLMGVGFINLFFGGIISGIWFIFIGLFLQEAADVSYRQVMIKKLLSGVKVDQFMSRNIVAVPAGIPLDVLVNDFFLKYKFTSFPVIQEDQLLGLITLHDVKEVPRDKWATITAREITIPMAKKILIDHRADAMHAMSKLANNGVGRLLVFDDHKLVGILSQRDVMRLFEVKTELDNE